MRDGVRRHPATSGSWRHFPEADFDLGRSTVSGHSAAGVDFLARTTVRFPKAVSGCSMRRSAAGQLESSDRRSTRTGQD